jgi:hypothetical protein
MAARVAPPPPSINAAAAPSLKRRGALEGKGEGTSIRAERRELPTPAVSRLSPISTTLPSSSWRRKVVLTAPIALARGVSSSTLSTACSFCEKEERCQEVEEKERERKRTNEGHGDAGPEVFRLLPRLAPCVRLDEERWCIGVGVDVLRKANGGENDVEERRSDGVRDWSTVDSDVGTLVVGSSDAALTGSGHFDGKREGDEDEERKEASMRMCWGAERAEKSVLRALRVREEQSTAEERFKRSQKAVWKGGRKSGVGGTVRRLVPSFFRTGDDRAWLNAV